jgi:hypothetical protein
MDSGGRSAANDSQNGALRARRPERVRLNPVSSRRASSPITYERRTSRGPMRRIPTRLVQREGPLPGCRLPLSEVNVARQWDGTTLR